MFSSMHFRHHVSLVYVVCMCLGANAVCFTRCVPPFGLVPLKVALLFVFYIVVSHCCCPHCARWINQCVHLCACFALDIDLLCVAVFHLLCCVVLYEVGGCAVLWCLLSFVVAALVAVFVSPVGLFDGGSFALPHLRIMCVLSLLLCCSVACFTLPHPVRVMLYLLSDCVCLCQCWCCWSVRFTFC